MCGPGHTATIFATYARPWARAHARPAHLTRPTRSCAKRPAEIAERRRAAPVHWMAATAAWRARNARVFTAATERPSSLAISVSVRPSP